MLDIYKYISLFIGVILLFLVLAELVPEAMDAGDDLNESGMPLGDLFASTGAVFVILAAGILLVVVGAVGIKKMRGK